MKYLIKVLSLIGVVVPVLLFVLLLIMIAPGAIQQSWMLIEVLSNQWNASYYSTKMVITFFISLWFVASYAAFTFYLARRSYRVLIGGTWYLSLDEGGRRYFPPIGRFFLYSLAYGIVVIAMLFLLVKL